MNLQHRSLYDARTAAIDTAGSSFSFPSSLLSLSLWQICRSTVSRLSQRNTPLQLPSFVIRSDLHSCPSVTAVSTSYVRYWPTVGPPSSSLQLTPPPHDKSESVVVDATIYSIASSQISSTLPLSYFLPQSSTSPPLSRSSVALSLYHVRRGLLHLLCFPRLYLFRSQHLYLELFTL